MQVFLKAIVSHGQSMRMAPLKGIVIALEIRVFVQHHIMSLVTTEQLAGISLTLIRPSQLYCLIYNFNKQHFRY